MPAVSQAQKRYMGYELGKQERTGSNDTGMSTKQLKDFTRGSGKGLPKRAKKRTTGRR